MDDFFAPPPQRRPDPQPRYRSPEWMGPPEGVLPGVVELELVLARSDVVAVCLGGVNAYPTGVVFELITMGGPGSEELDLDPHAFMRRMHRPGRGEEGLPPDLLRFGVELPDGRRVTNVGSDPFGEMAAAGDEDDDSFRPQGPVLMQRGGGGGGADWRQGMWLWPLPTPGKLTVACEWPVANIPTTRIDIDMAPILAAAERAQILFEFPEPPQDSEGGTYRIASW